MDRVPIPAPLPCFGLELNLRDDRCRRCPHMFQCHTAMGSRAGRVPIARARFDIVPRQFRIERTPDDPEIAHIDQLYTLCYRTVFNKHTIANLKPLVRQIAHNSRELGCSVRLYLLAAMIGHEHHQETVLGHSDRAFAGPFKPKMLVEKRTLEHVKTYADLCRQQFGTFTLGSLDLISQTEHESNDMELTMLRSEITAGCYIAQFKATRSGPPELDLYWKHEMDLDPHWLATEDSYMELVLKPYTKKHSGSEMLQRHRFSALQARAFMSRNPNAGIVAHLARNNIMKEAVRRVLEHFRLAGDSMEVKDEVITNSFAFWKELGRALQQYWCLRQYYGDASII